MVSCVTRRATCASEFAFTDRASRVGGENHGRLVGQKDGAAGRLSARRPRDLAGAGERRGRSRGQPVTNGDSRRRARPRAVPGRVPHSVRRRASSRVTAASRSCRPPARLVDRERRDGDRVRRSLPASGRRAARRRRREQRKNAGPQAAVRGNEPDPLHARAADRRRLSVLDGAALPPIGDGGRHHALPRRVRRHQRLGLGCLARLWAGRRRTAPGDRHSRRRRRPVALRRGGLDGRRPGGSGGRGHARAPLGTEGFHGYQRDSPGFQRIDVEESASIGDPISGPSGDERRAFAGRDYPGRRPLPAGESAARHRARAPPGVRRPRAGGGCRGDRLGRPGRAAARRRTAADRPPSSSC